MSLNESSATALLSRLRSEFKSKPFIPPRVLTQGDAQTLTAYCWPGRFRPVEVASDEERLFEVERDVRVLARCRWHEDRTQHATLVMWHGIEGSSASAYMLSMAAKAFRAGFNVVRMNMRNCGGTEHLTPTLYHGGMSTDARAVIEELIGRDRLTRILLAGFSLGGNNVLKMAGEFEDSPPPELLGVCAVSPSIDLHAGSVLLMKRRNWIYHHNFLYRLRNRIRLKAKLFPGMYDTGGLRSARTIRQFDERYVAPAFGFSGADDYYTRASSLPHIARIRIPTLIIHAQDDPFVPFAPLRGPAIAANPYVLVVGPEHGGHVGFVSANSNGEDRFWAENRLIEFCAAMSQ